jgi:hypothetical protein
MLRASRLPAVRICLLALSVVLLSAMVLALTADADTHRAHTSSNGHSPASSGASKRNTTKGKSPQSKCSRRAHGTKHRKAVKRCAVRRVKAPPTKAKLVGAGSSTGLPPGSSTIGQESTVQVAGATLVGAVPPVGEMPPVGGTTPVEGPAAPLEGPVGPVEGPIEGPVEPIGPFRFFSTSSIWNESVADAPVDPNSASVMRAFDALVVSEEQPGGGGPWINTTEYSVPVYTVPSDQPTVTVKLHDHHRNPVLSSAWSAVPLPQNAQPAIGTDGELVVWQPSTDRLWEFWRLVHEAGGWAATWGGAMQNVSSGAGVNGPESWPGAQTWWGASASSLSLVGGLISLEDLEKGQIDHALSMSIPNVRGGVYASPAERSDGKSSSPLSLPEGAHLRLNPNLNLAALHMPRFTLMLAEAAQRYGIFVRDHSAVVTLQAQDPVPTGTEPYTGPSGFFEGKLPSTLLASFPWNQLELVKMELHEVEAGE